MMRSFVAAILAASLLPATAIADDVARQLGAHVHGNSKLTIAFEAGTVSMELEAPAADIVGFEYEPSTGGQKAAIENAKSVLADPLDLFVLPANAGCSITSASVEHVFGAHENGESEHNAADGSHTEDPVHEDADHEEMKHSEFHATYQLACTDPVELDAIDFRFFDKFPNAQVIDVQAIGEAGQSGFTVERSSPRESLTGVTG